MSTRSTATHQYIDPGILKEAARWLTEFHAGEMSPRQQAEWLRWKQQSPAHQQAWEKAEGLLGKMRIIPAEFSRTLHRKTELKRRHLIKAGVAAVFVAPLAWMLYRNSRDGSLSHATDVGQRKTIALTDGTRIVLNTDSVLKVDFSNELRRVSLRQGEIFVQAVAERRPLIVATDDGWLRLQDAQFVLRRQRQFSQLAVVKGSVELTPAGGVPASRLLSGQRVNFSAGKIGQAGAIDPAQTSWLDGSIYADNMKLADFLTEVGRYREGVLMCDAAVADLRISGVFQLADTDRILSTLQHTLPVKVLMRTRYWVSVLPLSDTPART
ncbi:FecR family protein [Herbaspirillum lusitanum]|jgi:transmembrane sensor|uniref:FecR family protein n=1 Tax=Herbaspirillum lusitanum TaxID=213312 RepID=A0ABW9A849_9BURK